MPTVQTIRNLLQPIIHDGITPLVVGHGYTDTQINTWCSKTATLLGLHSNLPLAKFQWEEILHYFSPSDILTMTIGTSRDQACVESMFSTQGPNTVVQSPEETFQEFVESDQCVKCKSTDTMTMARQTRSADEPTSYYSECYACKHKWRSG